ncbi:hypothetical protein DSM106972_020520 [Dulcicalothrix desertica PCC 7102]|uniref:Uncharacterized protein n=1 Tax=Dulcicalothrix desertica PCC 7102 TaxID=232991 RepID=A0A433VP37_9CYAN|nr:hypothetical protein [Dulcicalothrix desertica]RUT07792.1 hypothetical protein DSM106972_020520 [Dulcicalothrix desertica PCC 7102]TWH39317.1 hypothetical protein CAL7102_08541 [Dulcicalothrix desertica PCC 7102]
MASKQLMASLTASLKNSLNRKQKLVLNENKLNCDILKDVKIGLDIHSTKRVIEIVFRILAVAELEKKQSIYKFSSYDYVNKIEELSNLSDGDCIVNIPIWMLIATSDIVREKYNQFEFKFIEDVIEVLLLNSFLQIQFLWNPK